jgi:hypothetical protein
MFGQTLFALTTASLYEEMQEFRHAPRQRFDPVAGIRRLLDLSTRHCRGPQDRIFTVGNILGVEGFGELVRDYHLPAQEVFRRFVVRCMCTDWDPTYHDPSHKIVLVGIVGTEGSAMTDSRPSSRVPALHRLGSHSMCHYKLYTWGKPQFRPSARRLQAKCEATDPSKLHVRGRCFATIVEGAGDASRCPRSWPTHNNEPDYWSAVFPRLVNWYQCCRSFVEAALGGPVEDQNFARLLSTGDDRAFEFDVIKDMDAPTLEEVAHHFGNMCGTSGAGPVESLYAALRPVLT